MRPHPTMRRTPTAISALLRRGFAGAIRIPGGVWPFVAPARVRGVIVVVCMWLSSVVDRLRFGDVYWNCLGHLDGTEVPGRLAVDRVAPGPSGGRLHRVGVAGVIRAGRRRACVGVRAVALACRPRV